MPFQIVRNNIAEMEVDAVVNTANPLPVVGRGCDTAIHSAAGPELMEARKKYGVLEIAKPVITPGFRLKASYVIHVAGPAWKGGMEEEQQLFDCYAACLALAAEHHLESVAFPLLSAGTYGFPAERALHIALRAVSAFLMDHEMKVFLAVIGGKPLQLSSSLFSEITAYVDEHYADALLEKEYGAGYGRLESRRTYAFSRPDSEDAGLLGKLQREITRENPEETCTYSAGAPGISQEAEMKFDSVYPTLEEMLRHPNEDFPTRMMRFVTEKNLIEKNVYNDANIDRKLFSKIRCGKGYVPKKSTVLALCIGLKLNVDEAEELLQTAGYSLTNSDRRDIVVRW